MVTFGVGCYLKWLQRQAALVKMKLKEFNEDPQQRDWALFSDQYSELEDENNQSDIPSRQKPEEDVFSFDKQAFEAQLLFSHFSLISGKNCRATSRVILKSSLSMIT